VSTDNLPAPVLALVAAGRHWLGTSPAAPPQDASDQLTDYALRHGMLAWSPAPRRDGVRRQHMTHALEGVRLLHVLTAALIDAHIPVVAFKGPAFSQWLYGDACARRFSDLDLLIAEAQCRNALGVLERLGFSPRLPRGAGDVVYRSTGAWPMDRKGSHTVDVHWRVCGPRFPQVASTAAVIERACEMSVGGRAVRVPCAEDTAALALAHAAKHVWYALELPFSIAAMMARTDIDWAEVRRLTETAGAVRGAAAGVSLASELFHVGVPAPFQADVGQPAVSELCRCARQTLALPPGIFPNRSLERHMHRLCFDRVTDRMRYDVRRLTEPTHADVTWVRLPPRLSAIYWPLRVVRLGTMLGQGMLQRGGH
jgi:hypothetical protein